MPQLFAGGGLPNTDDVGLGDELRAVRSEGDVVDAVAVLKSGRPQARYGFGGQRVAEQVRFWPFTLGFGLLVLRGSCLGDSLVRLPADRQADAAHTDS